MCLSCLANFLIDVNPKLTCGDCGAVYANRNSLTSHQEKKSSEEKKSLFPFGYIRKFLSRYLLLYSTIWQVFIKFIHLKDDKIENSKNYDL